VSAPNGIPITNLSELASQSSREAAQTDTASPPVITKASSGYGAQQMENMKLSASPLTTSAYPVYTSTSSLPSYGSGSSNWGNSQYDDCVQQCIASYGSGTGNYVPSATNTASYGTGATHTVVVAPTQGVLRYIPFAVNATVGDTIKFMWGANNHTVTKSSALLPCNRSGDALFASGTRNKDFVFTQVVNDTKPTYFFCATPGHCQKGMFGIINPATSFASPSSVARQMQSIAANNSDIQAYVAYTRTATKGNSQAGGWGGNIDLDALPDWARASAAENVLFTRNFLAANPETLKENGAVDLSSATSTPLSIPLDLSAALASTASSSSTASPAASTIAPPSSATTGSSSFESGTASSLNNGAIASAQSPRILVAVIAVFATFTLL